MKTLSKLQPIISSHSFVDVPYLMISANFQEPSSTTSTTTVSSPSITNSDTTTTSSESTMSTSVADIYYVFSNMSILINGTLYCPCNNTNETYPGLTSIYDNTNLTFEERIEDLTLDPDTLSLNTRRFESATDNRPSAATLGTFGLVIIIAFISFIVYLDSSTLIVEAKKIKKTVKVCKKKWNSKTTRVQSIKIDNKEEEIPIPDILK